MSDINHVNCLTKRDAKSVDAEWKERNKQAINAHENIQQMFLWCIQKERIENNDMRCEKGKIVAWLLKCESLLRPYEMHMKVNADAQRVRNKKEWKLVNFETQEKKLFKKIKFLQNLKENFSSF